MSAAKIFKLLFVFVAVFLISTASCYAFKWRPANLTDKQLQELIKNDKPDERKVTFWDLPLWIKIHYLLTLLLGVLGIWKFLPLILSKIRFPLDDSKKDRILRCLLENPGATAVEISKSTGINRSTLRYYLSRLEKDGIIYSAKAGKYRLFFPCAECRIDREDLVKSKRKRQILDILKQNGGLKISDIAECLGVSYHTAYRHVLELERMGAIYLEDGIVRINGFNE